MFKSVLALALAASVSPAYAQDAPPCFPFKELIAQLKTQYGEAPVLLGQTKSPGISVLITGTPNGSTWTIMIVRPDGIACFLANGTGMKEVNKPQGQEL